MAAITWRQYQARLRTLVVLASFFCGDAERLDTHRHSVHVYSRDDGLGRGRAAVPRAGSALAHRKRERGADGIGTIGCGGVSDSTNFHRAVAVPRVACGLWADGRREPCLFVVHAWIRERLGGGSARAIGGTVFSASGRTAVAAEARGARELRGVFIGLQHRLVRMDAAGAAKDGRYPVSSASGLALGVAAIAALIGAAYLARGAGRQRGDCARRTAPAWLAGLGAFVLGAAWFELIGQVFAPRPVLPFWITLTAAAAWAAPAFFLSVGWSSRTAGAELHRFASALGVTLGCNGGAVSEHRELDEAGRRGPDRLRRDSAVRIGHPLDESAAAGEAGALKTNSNPPWMAPRLTVARR